MSIWTQDRDRWFLWSPVLFGIGIHLFFSGYIMASIYIEMAMVILLVALWVCRKSIWAYIWIGGLCIFLGVATASFKTYQISQQYNRLNTEWGGNIVATVRDIDVMEGQLRLLLEDVTTKDRQFHRIRVNFRYKKNNPNEALMSTLRPGVKIKTYVRLFPVPPRETPLNYDFQFRSFFQGIEAVGFGGTRSIRILESTTDASFFDRLRYTITHKIREQKLDQKGEIAVALISGYQTGIKPEILNDFAGSGLAHILAISGLHLSLIGGLMFLILRRGLGLSTKIALHWPLKKISAVLAILCCFFYLKISGESIPAVRSFIMFGLIMLGIILNRDPISLRSVAWAGLVILAGKPESLYSPSFQMSFAAVAGLIGCYEYFREQSWKLEVSLKTSWIKKSIYYVGGSALSSLIASAATLPFIMHTFHRFSWHSIEANLIAIPLMAFWIMPLAIVVVVCMPLNIEYIPLTAMGWGVEILMQLANTINNLPGSFVPVGVRHEGFIVLILSGSFWWLIWTHRWRWLGVPLVIIAFLLPRKDIFLMMSNDRSRIGIVAGESVLITQTGRPNFVSQDWKGIVGAYELEKLSKSVSSWIKPTEWGWSIHPFLNDPSFQVAVISNPDATIKPDAAAVVLGFPKVRSILLNDDITITDGVALWKDSSGQIHCIQDSKEEQSHFPWR
jgi:competence protein ComEC